jgi:hypothetical protein
MKKLLFLLLMGGLIVLYADASIYGYFWCRYTYKNPTTPEVNENDNYFSVERGYVRWKSKTDQVSFKGTVDISQKQGATNKSDWNIRLKYAQADWKLPYIGEYIPEAKFMIGLQKVYFGIMDMWEYPVIEKNLEEIEKKTNSADLGIGFYGLIPSGFGEFSIQLFNGGGYTHVVETNTNKAVCGNLSFIPYPGIMLKGSYWMAQQPYGDTIVTQVDEQRYAGLLRIKYGPLTVLGEYLGTTDDEINGMGYCGLVELALSKKLNLLGRYDYFDPDVDIDTNGHNRVIGGVNYHISNALVVQINYQRKMYEDETLDDDDVGLLQFKYSY